MFQECLRVRIMFVGAGNKSLADPCEGEVWIKCLGSEQGLVCQLQIAMIQIQQPNMSPCSDVLGNFSSQYYPIGDISYRLVQLYRPDERMLGSSGVVQELDVAKYDPVSGNGRVELECLRDTSNGRLHTAFPFL